MYKIIVCDLDETLLALDRTIPKRNIEAIKRASALGVKFVPASGRGYCTIQGTLKELGLFDEEDQYIISFNGGAVTENKGNRLISFTGLPFETALALYERGIAYPDICLHVYTEKEIYVYNLNDSERDFLHNRQEVTEIREKSLDFLKGQDIVKILYEVEDEEYLRRLAEDVKDITGNCEVSYSSNRYVEFNLKGVDKGAGLRTLADLIGVDMKDTIAIGDNINDLAMIKAAGLGCGVGNVHNSVRPYCDYVAESDCSGGAVGEILEKFVLFGKE